MLAVIYPHMTGLGGDAFWLIYDRLRLLQPFLLTPLPVLILENLVTYSMKAVREPRALNPQCPVCQANDTAGYGNCAAPLGLDKNALAAIVANGDD